MIAMVMQASAEMDAVDFSGGGMNMEDIFSQFGDIFGDDLFWKFFWRRT